MRLPCGTEQPIRCGADGRGASPVDASSGKQQRHRYSRAGDRQANSALWRVVITRIVYDPRTSEYIQRRMKQGLTKREAMRCLKRYIARETYHTLLADLTELQHAPPLARTAINCGAGSIGITRHRT